MGLKIPWHRGRSRSTLPPLQIWGILELGVEEALELMMMLFPLCSSWCSWSSEESIKDIYLDDDTQLLYHLPMSWADLSWEEIFLSCRTSRVCRAFVFHVPRSRNTSNPIAIWSDGRGVDRCMYYVASTWLSFSKGELLPVVDSSSISKEGIGKEEIDQWFFEEINYWISFLGGWEFFSYLLCLSFVLLAFGSEQEPEQEPFWLFISMMQ